MWYITTESNVILLVFLTTSALSFLFTDLKISLLLLSFIKLHIWAILAVLKKSRIHVDILCFFTYLDGQTFNITKGDIMHINSHFIIY